MKIQENIQLALMTTIRVGGPARYFVEVEGVEEIKEVLTFAKEKKLPVFILGGGSNVLVSDDGFKGLIIKINLRGREVIFEDENSVTLKIGAGEILDDVIAWTVENGWWGLENLSFVPGTVGGATYMNAGCYGQEIAEAVDSITVLDLELNKVTLLSKKECGFSYRKSIFGADDKDRFIIIEVNLVLKKNGVPNLQYADLEKWFVNDENPPQKKVREAIIEIRTKKGQDPRVVWSAGSFFSNFRLSPEEFEILVAKIEKDFSSSYAVELRELVKKVKAPSDEGMVKVPTAWILDRLLGLKGFKIGGAMHSAMQVLNLINTGNASSKDIISLYDNAKKLVFEKTGLNLVSEPEFVGF